MGDKKRQEGYATPRATKSEQGSAAVEALREACSVALRSAGEYAPEVQPGQARGLIAELELLDQALGVNAPTDSLPGEESRRVRQAARAALRAYQRQVQQQIAEMRKEVETAQSTIHEFAEGLSAGNASHRDGVAREIEALKSAAAEEDIHRVRKALGKASAGIRLSYAAFVRARQMAILQLQDEIRVLRETIAAHQRERERDPESGAWRREYFEVEVRFRLARREATSLLLLTIHNLEALQAANSQEAMLGFFDAFGKRLASVAGKDKMIARWSPDAFALLLPATGPPAEEVRDRLCAKLPGAYAVQVDGTAYRLMLDLTVRIVDAAVEFAANQ